ncbi:hypothetical protein AB1N83_009426 [Pleurotus pulmonarius]
MRRAERNIDPDGRLPHKGPFDCKSQDATYDMRSRGPWDRTSMTINGCMRPPRIERGMQLVCCRAHLLCQLCGSGGDRPKPKRASFPYFNLGYFEGLFDLFSASTGGEQASGFGQSL